MQKIGRFALAAILLAGTALLGHPSSARAGLIIQVSVDGGAFFNVASGGPGSTQSFSGQVSSTGIVASGGIFSLNMLSGSSNSPGTPSLAFVLGSSLALENLTTATHSIEIRIGDIGFTRPITPPSIVVASHIGGSVLEDNAANTMTFQSWVNQGGGQNAVTGFTPGPQNPNITTGSFLSDAFTTIPSLTAGYSITQQYRITLGGGSLINWAANTRLAPVPEPATLATAFAAVPLLGLGAWIRRRRPRQG